MYVPHRLLTPLCDLRVSSARARRGMISWRRGLKLPKSNAKSKTRNSDFSAHDGRRDPTGPAPRALEYVLRLWPKCRCCGVAAEVASISARAPHSLVRCRCAVCHCVRPVRAWYARAPARGPRRQTCVVC
eukprot:4516692-Prymnesium_polylepis.1